MSEWLAQVDTPALLAIAGALGWASGLRLYLIVFLAGLSGAMGWVELPAGLKVLQHPAMLGASGFMLFVEFFADKIPGVDTLWDMVQTFVRVPAGAALAAAALGADSTAMTMAAALLGGTLAATAHATKASARMALNTSPEPVSNVVASLAEDGLVVGAWWLATQHPLAFGVALAIAVVLMLALLVTLARFFKSVAQRVAGVFR